MCAGTMGVVGLEPMCLLNSHSSCSSSAWGPGTACAPLGGCVDASALCFTLHLLLQIVSCPFVLEQGFFFLMFIYLFRETERKCEQGRGRERERDNPKKAPCCQCRACIGARPHELLDHALSQSQELVA